MCGGELSLSKIKPCHNRARDFAESPWFPWPVVLIYRLILAAYCVGWIIYSGFHSANGGPKWFIYLTNWGYFCLTVYFIVATLVTMWYNVRERNEAAEDLEMKHYGSFAAGDRPDESNELPMKWHHKASWVIYNTVATSAMLITVIYWSFSFLGTTSGLDISTHLLNTIFVLAEVMLSSIPIHFLHFVYSFLFAMCYLIFTVIYWAVGGTNAQNNPYVYSYVDYSKNPGLAVGIILGAALVGLPIFQLFIFGLYKLRCFVAQKCSRVTPR